LASIPRRIAIVLLPLWLAACAGGGDGNISFTDDRSGNNQPYPTNYRVDLLAFLKTYLINPVGVREAMLAEPVQRTINGRLRYIVCVRYTPKDSDGRVLTPQERGVMFVDGRLDRVIENAGESCAGATYVAFPEMEKMTR
jgi:hypothetical protein